MYLSPPPPQKKVFGQVSGCSELIWVLRLTYELYWQPIIGLYIHRWLNATHRCIQCNQLFNQLFNQLIKWLGFKSQGILSEACTVQDVFRQDGLAWVWMECCAHSTTKRFYEKFFKKLISTSLVTCLVFTILSK